MDQLQVSFMIIRGIVFNLKQYENINNLKQFSNIKFWRTIFLVKLKHHLISAFSIQQLDLFGSKNYFGREKDMLPPRPPQSPSSPWPWKKVVGTCRRIASCKEAVLKSFEKFTLKHLWFSPSELWKIYQNNCSLEHQRTKEQPYKIVGKQWKRYKFQKNPEGINVSCVVEPTLSKIGFL